jgi:hypothetical protein
MNRPLPTLGLAVAAVVLPARAAWAEGPTTTQCLAASDASLKAATEHRFRDERAQLLTCAAPSCPAVVRKECLSQVDEVNARIPTVIFFAKDASGKDLGAVRVTMDGDLLAERLEGTALSVDPGEHTFAFETAGQAPITMTFLFQQAQKDRHEQIAFHPVSDPAASPPAAPDRPGLGTQKIVALAAGGAGIVGLGIGAAFGAVALSEKSDAQSICPGAACPTPSGVTKWSNATTSANISTVALVVGAVGVGAGVVLWLTAPHAGATPGAQLGLGPGSLQLRGTW